MDGTSEGGTTRLLRIKEGDVGTDGFEPQEHPWGPSTRTQWKLHVVNSLTLILWFSLVVGAFTCYGGFLATLGATLDQTTNPLPTWWSFGPVGLGLACASMKIYRRLPATWRR